MTVEEMKAEIVTELTEDLVASDADLFNLPLLTSKVNSAVKEVMAARQYPASYTADRIGRDIVRYYAQIKAIAYYDYSQSGSEGQTSFSGDGNSIHYVDRKEYFSQILPIATVV